MKITLVAGARPNFVKVAPIHRELKRRDIETRLLHTGQHRGALDVWAELELPEPARRFECGGLSHAEQVAEVLVAVENDLRAFRADWLVVVGDVNSTLGAALAAVKLGVKIAHVEAGYRSHDWTMPEEVNRVLVDRMSDLLLCPDEEAQANADLDTKPAACVPGCGKRKSVPTVCVGNVMMDSLRWALARIQEKWISPNFGPLFDIARAGAGGYAVLTCHRPSNVDATSDFERVRRAVAECPYPIVWPVHPRAARHELDGVHRIDPLGYLDMVALLHGASAVITDSGGLLEEALYLGKSIVSLRDPAKNERAHLIENGVPEIWKSDAAPRIVDALLEAG